ncbi:MAG: LuxR C-terminal-related transcriptional regulator [Chloroflexi bacterium]|nr:LuxR C-terminal-related transcriptional regulator [Chloroflexota bacterium]
MERTDPLIRTKLRLPFTRPGLVSRPRLQEQITQGLRGPLTLITAPAGFGKTTLAASCIAICGMPVAWFSLDKDDNQPGRFLIYLIAALQSVDRQIGSEAVQLMAGMQQAPPEAVLVSLINDLDAATAEMVLVLDDYHFISSQAVHSALAFLLEHCPRTLHLVIASRSDPPLPIIRLRARGQTVELRAADLSFTEIEAAQFLNEIMGLCLDAGSVALLEERTEGWAAGLQMAALSMRDRKDVFGFIEGFSGTNRYILDYLMEEVLASQPPEINHFLLCTSILERLTASLCEAILQDESGSIKDEVREPTFTLHPSSFILDYLERANLFLVPLDDERIWFRYHHLFADLLRVRLHQAQPNLKLLLHIRAAAWLEQNGFIPEAIQQLFAAQEIDRAADLIEHYGPVRWAESDLSVVQMADSLPREILINRPKLGLYLAWLLILQGLIEKALPLLKDMAQQLAGADLDSGQQWIETIVRLALAFLVPPPITPGSDPLPDDQELNGIPSDEIILRDAADILYGMALGRRGEIDRAAEFSLKSIQRMKMHHGLLVIPTLVPFLATIYLFQGRLHAAASLCREFLDPIKEKGLRISTVGNMDVVMGDVQYEWNNLEEAAKHIRDGLQANEPWGNIMTDAFGLLALTHVLLAKGDHAGAMQIVEKFETRLQDPRRPVEFREAFFTLRVRVQLASGDLQNASHWADQIQHSEDFHLHPSYYRLTLARIRLAQGMYADAEKMLTSTPPLEMYGNRITGQIESNLLLATAKAGQQRLPEAFALIDSCLALAEPEGYVRVFLDEGEPMQLLLAQWLAHACQSPLRDFAAHVLSQFEAEPHLETKVQERTSPVRGMVEPLSQRELEVLHLIALGRTNQEIARQLIVSPGTVKAHTASIYRKLDVANRTEAVARARKLSILP